MPSCTSAQSLHCAGRELQEAHAELNRLGSLVRSFHAAVEQALGGTQW